MSPKAAGSQQRSPYKCLPAGAKIDIYDKALSKSPVQTSSRNSDHTIKKTESRCLNSSDSNIKTSAEDTTKKKEKIVYNSSIDDGVQFGFMRKKGRSSDVKEEVDDSVLALGNPSLNTDTQPTVIKEKSSVAFNRKSISTEQNMNNGIPLVNIKNLPKRSHKSLNTNMPMKYDKFCQQMPSTDDSNVPALPHSIQNYRKLDEPINSSCSKSGESDSSISTLIGNRSIKESPDDIPDRGSLKEALFLKYSSKSQVDSDFDEGTLKCNIFNKFGSMISNDEQSDSTLSGDSKASILSQFALKASANDRCDNINDEDSDDNASLMSKLSEFITKVNLMNSATHGNDNLKMSSSSKLNSIAFDPLHSQNEREVTKRLAEIKNSDHNPNCAKKYDTIDLCIQKGTLCHENSDGATGYDPPEDADVKSTLFELFSTKSVIGRNVDREEHSGNNLKNMLMKQYLESISIETGDVKNDSEIVTSHSRVLGSLEDVPVSRNTNTENVCETPINVDDESECASKIDVFERFQQLYNSEKDHVTRERETIAVDVDNSEYFGISSKHSNIEIPIDTDDSIVSDSMSKIDIFGKFRELCQLEGNEIIAKCEASTVIEETTQPPTEDNIFDKPNTSNDILEDFEFQSAAEVSLNLSTGSEVINNSIETNSHVNCQSFTCDEIKDEKEMCNLKLDKNVSDDDDPELIVDSQSPRKTKRGLDSSLSSSFGSCGNWMTKNIGIFSYSDVPICNSTFRMNGNKETCQDSVRALSTSVEEKAEDLVIDDGEIDFGDIPLLLNSPQKMSFDTRLYSEDMEMMESNSTMECNGGLIESILTPKIVVHSKSGLALSPWPDMNHTTFSNVLINNLKCLGVKSPSKIQGSVWPTIVRGGSAFVIGPVNSGKGVSVLAPICNKFANILSSEIPQESSGPLLLIVCPDIRTATRTYSVCMTLLANCMNMDGKPFKIIKVDDYNNSSNMWKFLEQSDIMISTPQCLYQYMTYKVCVVNIKRLLYLYLEDLDILNDKCKSEMDTIIGLCKKAASERSDIKLQIYATSKVWSGVLGSLALDSFSPTLLIGALQECIFYSGMDLKIKFVTSDCKIEKVRKLLKDAGVTLRRTVVVCVSDAEVTAVCKALNSDGHMYLKADTSMSIDVLNETRQSWKNCKIHGGNLILVCCDENLLFLDIGNAHCLIHYSLPITFAKFNLRFSTMALNYPNLYSNVCDKLKLKVDIFVDEENSLQLPKIVQFVTRYGVQVPDPVNDLLQNIFNLKDIKKADTFVPLCEKLATFGLCPDSLNCIERHSVVPKDMLKEWIPKTGIVKCKVLFVHHSSLFSVRILEHITFEGISSVIQQNNIRIAIEMESYFSVEENKIPLAPVKLGDLCAIDMGTHYERCQIVRIISINNKRHSANILVTLLEVESYVLTKLSDLFYLPDHLKEMCSTVINIRIPSLLPISEDLFWSTTCIRDIRNKLTQSDDLFIRGNIVLGLGNTLWLDNVKICNHLKTLRVDTVRCNLRNYMLTNNYAVHNPQHLITLYNLCNTFNLQLPSYEVPKKSFNMIKETFKPQWAHLPEGEYTKVNFSSAVSLDQLFVRILAHEQILESMNEDLQKHVAKLQSNLVEIDSNLTDEAIASGFYCIAKFFEDGLYYRARIDKMFVDHQMGKMYHCFFVDYGERANVKHDDVFPINEKFIKRLPCQAIECKLYGLKPKGNHWTESDTDALYNYTTAVLYAKYYTKDIGVCTGGHRYAVNLVDKTNGKSLTHSFIKNDLANGVEGELELIAKDVVFVLEEPLINSDDIDSSDEESNTDESKRMIPNFILGRNNKLLPNISTIDDASKIENLVYPESDDSDAGEWDCQFDKDDYVFLKNAKNLPALLEGAENVTDLASKVSSEEYGFTIIDKSDVEISSNNCNEIQARNVLKPAYNMPHILWYQNDTFVVVKVQLPGVTLYECDFTKKSLYFKTCISDSTYLVDLELYGGVNPNRSFSAEKASYVMIKLYKLTKMVWETLSSSEIKDKRIVYDPDFVNFDDDECSDNEGDKLKENLKRVEDCSDESDSDAGSEGSMRYGDGDLTDQQMIKFLKNLDEDSDESDV